MMILVLFFLFMMGSTMGEITIIGTIQECDKTSSSLHCDFADSTHQEVYLNPLDGQTKDIYVENLQKLHVAESVCNNVHFHNISEIVVEGERNEYCEEGFGLLAVNSSFNKLPESVRTVSLSHSTIEVLQSNKNLEKLIVNNSNIATLRISGPFNKNPYVEIHGSRIVKTEELVLEDGAELKVESSTFVNLLKIRIMLTPGVSLTLKKVVGDFLVTNNNEDMSFNYFWNIYVIIGIFVIQTVFLLFNTLKKIFKFIVKKISQWLRRDMHEDTNNPNNSEQFTFIEVPSSSNETDQIGENEIDENSLSVKKRTTVY